MPACYIRAHLDVPNPFVEGRLSLQGPTYHSKIHAAAIHDVCYDYAGSTLCQRL
jgi:hypothetical protein